MGATTRRNLYYEADQEYDPNITIDVNEYLIESWPQLSLKQRTSVWTLAQNDEDFDYDVVYDQIDNYVYDLAETDQSIELPPEDEEDEDEEEDIESCLLVNVTEYLQDNWPDLTEDQASAIRDKILDDDEFNFEPIYDVFDEYVVDYAETVDSSIDLSCLDEDDEDEDDEDEAA